MNRKNDILEVLCSCFLEVCVCFSTVQCAHGVRDSLVFFGFNWSALDSFRNLLKFKIFS